MKNKRKYMLCQYPDNGFGEKNNQYYLLDVFGNKYDIEKEYDNVLDEPIMCVRLGDGSFDVYFVSTLDKLINLIEQRYDIKIERW